jgi:DNA-binding transcriptional LysR family regulator
VDFTIAFIGDQGDGADADAVLQLISDEGADAVVHSGDFDYGDKPELWDALITGRLGEDFPYFAACGNHDDGDFYGPGGYQEFQAARLNRLGITWSGDLGVASALTYRGIFIVLTAPDVFGDGDSVYAPFIRSALAGTDAIWRISSWHKNMHAMQAGGRTTRADGESTRSRASAAPSSPPPTSTRIPARIC